MKNFGFAVNQNVIFEVNGLQKVIDIIHQKNFKKVFIVAGKGIEKAGFVKKLSDILDEACIPYGVFVDIDTNPTLETVDITLDCYKKSNADCIVALGGGSSMDVAKIVAVVDRYGGKVSDYAVSGSVPGPITSIIAIPTTAGTGSESTCTAVVTDTKTGYKFAVTSPYVLPEFAILDPTLITTLPASIAASTGIDALVHAMETYLSNNATPFTDAMAEKAMELIGKNIRLFVANRSNVEAASGMIVGSNFAGVAFTKAWLGDVHALAHPISGFFNVPHGIACAILLPVVLEYNSLSDNGKYARMYQILTGKNIDKDFEPIILIDYIRKLIADLEIPSSLSEVGVSKDKIPDLVNDAMKSGNIKNNPRQATASDVEKLYMKCFVK